MSASEDIVIVDSSDYAQVVFDDVKECYSNAKPLECVFTLNELLKSEDSTDWIGIYKVGFSSCDEYMCNVPIDQVTDNKGKVAFIIEVLPKEDGEFYQFVYVSNGKQIRGASVPFQFKLEECTELTDDEDNDAVVVKFDSGDTITEIKNRCVQLSNSNQAYEKLIQDNESLIKSLKEEVASIKLRCFRLTMDNEKLNFTLRSKADSLKNLAETISSLTQDNNSLQSRFNDLSNDNKNLLESLQERISQVASLKSELESVRISKGEFEEVLSLKEAELLQLEKDKNELSRIVEELNTINEQITKLEDQVSERTEEINQIKTDLRKNNILVAEQAETIQTILAEKNELNNIIETLKKEKSELEGAGQELTMSKEKLNAAEQCKNMLIEQLSTVVNELDETKKKMSVQYNVANDLTDRIAQIEFEKSTNDKKLNEIKAEYEEKLNQINGSYYVLRVAHSSLETRLKSNEQRRAASEKEIENQRKSIEDLKKENHELKERINHGAHEYTKLFEKCRLLKNQKFSNDMKSNYDEDNQLTRRRTNINSTQCETSQATNIQDKTVSQARVSGAESENTLLDALLGSSFYNSTWQNDTNKTASSSSKIAATPVTKRASVITTTQPKSPRTQSNDLSDDGLVHGKSNYVEQPKKTENLTQKLSRCQIGESVEETKNPNCEICDFIFPTGANEDELAKHMSTHFSGHTCPVCFLQFNKGYSQEEFEYHVDSHFSN